MKRALRCWLIGGSGGSGAGKTTPGLRLAQRLLLPFIDLDEL